MRSEEQLQLVRDCDCDCSWLTLERTEDTRTEQRPHWAASSQWEAAPNIYIYQPTRRNMLTPHTPLSPPLLPSQLEIFLMAPGNDRILSPFSKDIKLLKFESEMQGFHS